LDPLSGFSVVRAMSESVRWEAWLAEADSVEALAPAEYHAHAALVRVKALYPRLRQALPEYKVSATATDLYQDGTGLAGYRGDFAGAVRPLRPFACLYGSFPFRNLSTVEGCNDPDLLARIRGTLDNFGLRYIDHEYLATRTYNGNCEGLQGLSFRSDFVHYQLHR
jgi:hypothetical protein